MKDKRVKNFTRNVQPIDLNTLEVENHDTRGDEALDALPASSGSTTVYFRNLEDNLIHHISQADAVLGCVAWLTSRRILDALSQKDPVAIVVQKEDFLRPDLDSRNGWVQELRRRYSKLHCSWERYNLPGWVSNLSYASDPSMQPVRCVGNYNRDKNPAFPRMHHKFIVLCRITAHRERGSVWNEEKQEWENGLYDVSALSPYAVWTGSFNFTENGVRSLENALLVTHSEIVQAYVEEWSRIEALSEPLDWESDWVAPEWRIGT